MSGRVVGRGLRRARRLATFWAVALWLIASSGAARPEEPGEGIRLGPLSTPCEAVQPAAHRGSLRRMATSRLALLSVGLLMSSLIVACDDDDGEGLSPAQLHGVGAACTQDSDCYVGDMALSCLS